uniref:Uncharacterized protein n=1 Tax=Lactuca sativa TaxID=4236 RepID=A0A9R1VGX7_LACSA|nr:hypothetical protein LSAT_V11C500245210 [Lactuca sativa]
MELSPTYVLSNSIAEEIHKERAVVIAIVDLKVLEGVVCGVEPTTALPSLPSSDVPVPSKILYVHTPPSSPLLPGHNGLEQQEMEHTDS